MLSRLHSERGAALLLTSIFMLMSLSIFSMLHRRVLMMMHVVQFETYLDQPATHTLETGFAHAVSLMQTGLPSAAYSCSLVLTETNGNPIVDLTWTPQGAKWDVTVVESATPTYTRCPDDFSNLT